MQNSRTNWVWMPQWRLEDKEAPKLVLFRKKIKLHSECGQARVKISADSRYKLYLNGQMIEMGPSRGDRQIWFYDEIDLLPYLKKGNNVLAVQVLRYPMEYLKGNYGMFRTEYPGLFVEGLILDAMGNEYSLNADESWKCRRDEGFCIVSEAEGFAPLQIYEKRQGDPNLKGWMLPDYVDIDWDNAKPYQEMSRSVSPGNLCSRTIPFLYRKNRRFQGITAIRQSQIDRGSWERLLKQEASLMISPHSIEVVEITAGEEMTAYLHLSMCGGKGAQITLLQSESYVQGKSEKSIVKKNRNDWQNGHLQGFVDQYLVGGFGTEEQPEEYEPFWFRTFRFVRLEIQTKDEPLTLVRFDYTETGYPLEVQTQVIASDPDLEPIWKISERTLRRCMHETYEDCPFYEQQQYAMDSRLEILYTYAVSADDRLARKCMDDFKRAARYDGLMNCSYPCVRPNIIPGFSIHYILMLYDHMMYFGDRLLLEEHMPTVEGILNFFQRNLTEDGYVDKLGGLNGKDKNWSFIDWTPEWDATTGVPPATLKGPITMESLLYIMGLQHAAALAEYLNRKELAELYLTRAEAVQKAVREHCMGRDGMIQDGPGVEEYSQHVQVFAILTDTVDTVQGKENLEKTLLYPEQYAQCSVAMMFYLFRALQNTKLYFWTQEYWRVWTRMIEKDVTTCVEDEVGERSDCHGWGALILYELPTAVLGIKPAKPGYQAVCISPEPGYLKHAKGSVKTPKGEIKVSWGLEKGGTLTYEVPENISLYVDDTALQEAAEDYLG